MSAQSVIVTVLVVALVGAAVYGGLRIFSSESVDSARDALKQELIDIGTEAVYYHKRPRLMGGGEKDFKNFKPQKRAKDKTKGKKERTGSSSTVELTKGENGIFYLIFSSRDSLIIDAVGHFAGADSTKPIRIRLTQTPSSRRVETLN